MTPNTTLNIGRGKLERRPFHLMPHHQNRDDEYTSVGLSGFSASGNQFAGEREKSANDLILKRHCLINVPLALGVLLRRHRCSKIEWSLSTDLPGQTGANNLYLEASLLCLRLEWSLMTSRNQDLPDHPDHFCGRKSCGLVSMCLWTFQTMLPFCSGMQPFFWFDRTFLVSQTF